ncbi:MAG: hypothetical protein ACPF8V_10055 [Luteibaculum sp.]
MAEFKIRKKYFWMVFALLLLLPISIEWQLVCFGEETTGTVIPIRNEEDKPKFKISSRPDFEVHFRVQGMSYYTIAGDNQDLYAGQQIEVTFLPDAPNNNYLNGLYGIYSGWNLVITGVVLLFWFAAYLVFRI